MSPEHRHSTEEGKRIVEDPNGFGNGVLGYWVPCQTNFRKERSGSGSQPSAEEGLSFFGWSCDVKSSLSIPYRSLSKTDMREKARRKTCVDLHFKAKKKNILLTTSLTLVCTL
jgi:hypothetical protein